MTFVVGNGIGLKFSVIELVGIKNKAKLLPVH